MVKIIRKGINKAAYEMQFKEATKGCWEQCPYCGARMVEYMGQHSVDSSVMYVARFCCNACDAMWESAPYYSQEYFRERMSEKEE